MSKKLEVEDQEEEESQWIIRLDTLLDPQNHPQADLTVTAFGISLTIRQESREALGGRVWGASLGLLKFLEDNVQWMDWLKGKRILELGSGTGLLGIGLSFSGAKEIMITDQRCLLKLMEENVKRNPGGSPCCVRELDWREEGLEIASGGPYDLVLAADCVYWDFLYEPLIKTLVTLSEKGTRVLLANDDRRTSSTEYEKNFGQRWDYLFFQALDENFDSEILTGKENPCRIVLCTKKRPEGQGSNTLKPERALK